MARADLHYALAVDHEIHQASRVDPALLDPIVRVEGGLPGTARPFVVVRDYQGPQGFYTEQFVIRDARGGEVYRSPVQRVELKGEMFEDRFTTLVDGVAFDDPDDHELVFHILDEEVGSIPLFVQIGEGGDPRVAAEETFKKALGKGEIIWLAVPQPAGGRRQPVKDHTQPVWFVYEGGKVYVLSGPGEQDVPNLTGASEVEIIARSKDLRSHVSTARATVRQIPADSDEFTKLAEKMLGGRLNLPDGDAALDRWRRDCVMVELTPRFHREGQAPAA